MRFRSGRLFLSMLLAAGTVAGCKKKPAEAPPKATDTPPSDTPKGPETPKAPETPPGMDMGHDQPGAHQDHAARHGGVVVMDGDLHSEVVLDPAGQHKAYFSDAVRKDLPASAVKNVTLTVKRKSGEEKLSLKPDPTGAFWVADGKPLADADGNVRFAYDREGQKSYFIDVPLPEAPEKAPASLKEAAQMIDEAQQKLAGIVKDGDLSKAHMAADRLKSLGAALPELAAKAGLGPDDVKALTIAGKRLGLLFGDMDEAGDSGKRDEAQQVFARYAEPLATIKAKSPSQ